MFALLTFFFYIMENLTVEFNGVSLRQTQHCVIGRIPWSLELDCTWHKGLIASLPQIPVTQVLIYGTD